MICLHCGECCTRLLPAGTPCPKLEVRDTFYFCADYANRPSECKAHCYPFATCPVGQKKLNIAQTGKIHERIDTGYAMLTFNMNNPTAAYDKLINKGGSK